MISDIKHGIRGSVPLITLENITIRVRDQFILAGTNWTLKKNQHWAVIGPNGAGKSSFVRAIAGELPVVQGKIIFHAGKSFRRRICYVSFELQQRLIASEEARDESRYFSGRLNDVTTARDLICASKYGIEPRRLQSNPIVEQLNIEHLLDRGIRYLSTGEMRKILIARAMINSPHLLILDEPFDGLDAAAHLQLVELINGLMDANRQIILVTHRLDEMPPNITHVMGIKAGRVSFQGRRNRMLSDSNLERLYHRRRSCNDVNPIAIQNTNPASGMNFPVLVEMKHATVRYKDVIVLNGLNWKMKFGQNWAVAGPNGAGKTTLLSLISGDNPQAYANEIYLFGKRRGTGESIWDIKQKIGLISSEFQIRYRKPLNARDVILSGFFDSVGLYRRCTAEQRRIAASWIEYIRLADKAAKSFNRLSYGEQRLVLLARAMVKMPVLLILDEPCQGLDRANRKMVLNLIDAIAATKRTHILYVTHHHNEIPDCISHILLFEQIAPRVYSPKVYPL
jgi:molybdate transport system ATP-binding protein